MTLITSPSNARVKAARALAQRKQRDVTGLCLAEGIFHVGEALDGASVEYLLHAPDLLASPFGRSLVDRAAEQGIPVLALTPEVMASVSDKDNPQGLVAVVRQRRYSLADISPANFSFGAALVSPQDPGNVGTILRTLDAVAGAGLLLLDDGVDAYHPSAVRASMGAVFRLPVVSAAFAEFTAWASKHGYHVIGTSARGHTDYRAAERYPLPLVLLLGSERLGLTAAQIAACETVLRLPMHGRVSSLNLSVAAGVLLYAIHDVLDARGALPGSPATP